MWDDGSWIDELFAAIDRMDAVAFAEFFEPEATFRFGNFPPVSGRAAIAQSTAAIFATLGAVRHYVEERWLLPDAAIVTGTVTYTRLDGSTLQVPFANVMKPRAGKIHGYFIFVDNSALFASQGVSGEAA